jgi:hypothetical protein
MATINDADTRSALREIGCLHEDEGELDSTAFIGLLAERLEAEHIAGTEADVAMVETTVGQLVTAVVGRSDEQLVELAKPWLGTGADGRVQKALSNGYVLCGNRAPFVFDIEGEQVSKKIPTRFLSGDPDVIEKYSYGPRQKRMESFAKGVIALTELVEARQPDMAVRNASFLERLTVTWHKALPQAGDAA